MRRCNRRHRKRRRFFQALNYYLTTHAAQTADSTELLRSIWTRTGKELGWFFYEWVFKGGHPDYRVSASYDPGRKAEVLTVAQTQSVTANTPVFDMPIELAIFRWTAIKEWRRGSSDYAADQNSSYQLPLRPHGSISIRDDILYKTVVFDKTDDELIREAESDPHMMSRLWAAQQLGDKLREDQSCCVQALSNILDTMPSMRVRIQAAASLGAASPSRRSRRCCNAMSQPDSRVRAAAVSAMGNFLRRSGTHRCIDQGVARRPQLCGASGRGRTAGSLRGRERLQRASLQVGIQAPGNRGHGGIGCDWRKAGVRRQPKSSFGMLNRARPRGSASMRWRICQSSRENCSDSMRKRWPVRSAMP